MKLYLDNNIFIYLENGSMRISDLEDLIQNKITKIVYSAAHIQESLEIKGKNDEEKFNRIFQRLKTIENITNSFYLNENLNTEVFEIIESPYEVYKTITEVPFAQNAMKSLANFVDEEQRRETRALLNINPELINNYSPSEVVEQLSKKLSSSQYKTSFLDMIEAGFSYFPNGQNFGLSNRIAAIFELLDLLGYWKDKYNDKSNYARLWDSNHCFYASYCDYFISNDKRTVNKSKVVYSLYNITTQIISPDSVSITPMP